MWWRLQSSTELVCGVVLKTPEPKLCRSWCVETSLFTFGYNNSILRLYGVYLQWCKKTFKIKTNKLHFSQWESNVHHHGSFFPVLIRLALLHYDYTSTIVESFMRLKNVKIWNRKHKIAASQKRWCLKCSSLKTNGKTCTALLGLAQYQNWTCDTMPTHHQSTNWLVSSRLFSKATQLLVNCQSVMLLQLHHIPTPLDTSKIRQQNPNHH